MITLTKAHHEPVRWDCAAEDLSWVLEGRPLWTDDASYIAHMGDGVQGHYEYELNLRAGDAPLDRVWVHHDDEPLPAMSRADRLAEIAAGDAAWAARLLDAANVPF